MLYLLVMYQWMHRLNVKVTKINVVNMIYMAVIISCVTVVVG